MEQAMVKFPALPQLAKIAAILLLFLLVPFVLPSLRAPYLYILLNALVLALGVQAGLLSVSGLRDEKKSLPTPGTSSPNLQTKLVNEAAAGAAMTNNADGHLFTGGSTVASPLATKQAPLIELLADRAAIKDVVGVAKKLKEKIKKCPSRASIFFIGNVDSNDDGEVVDATSSNTVQKDHHAEEGAKKWKVDDASTGDLMSKQELFTKAEAFIGNFYKQLNMQREESWNKLQDLYNYHHHYKTKAF